MGGDLDLVQGADATSLLHNSVMYDKGCPWRDDSSNCQVCNLHPWRFQPHKMPLQSVPTAFNLSALAPPVHISQPAHAQARKPQLMYSTPAPKQISSRPTLGGQGLFLIIVEFIETCEIVLSR